MKDHRLDARLAFLQRRNPQAKIRRVIITFPAGLKNLNQVLLLLHHQTGMVVTEEQKNQDGEMLLKARIVQTRMDLCKQFCEQNGGSLQEDLSSPEIPIRRSQGHKKQ